MEVTAITVMVAVLSQELVFNENLKLLYKKDSNFWKCRLKEIKNFSILSLDFVQCIVGM